MLWLCRKHEIRTEEMLSFYLEYRVVSNSRAEAAEEPDTIWGQKGQDFLLRHLIDICGFRLRVWANGLQVSVKQPKQTHSIACIRSIFQGHREPSAELLGCVNFKLVIFKSQDKMLWFCCNRLPDTWADCGALQRTFGLTKLWLGNGSCSFFICHLCSHFSLHWL